MTGPISVLSANHYTFAYGEKRLLDDVSFEILPGARCAIIGPNGAGKSTLLKSFSRILPAGEGELRLHGQALRRYTQKELARWIAYVPQGAGPETLFTVREFVMMGRYPYLSPFSSVRHEDRVAVESALNKTGLQEFGDRPLQTLSGGERQKVFIAAALVQGSRILLLDEPAAFLDPHQQDQVYNLLDRLHREEGVTLVEVTHDVNRAALEHDQVIALRRGRVIFNGTPEQLMNSETLAAVYGKTFVFAPHPADGRPLAVPGVRP